MIIWGSFLNAGEALGYQSIALSSANKPFRNRLSRPSMLHAKSLFKKKLVKSLNLFTSAGCSSLPLQSCNNVPHSSKPSKLNVSPSLLSLFFWFGTFCQKELESHNWGPSGVASIHMHRWETYESPICYNRLAIRNQTAINANPAHLYGRSASWDALYSAIRWSIMPMRLSIS